jgi:hypothetical protein
MIASALGFTAVGLVVHHRPRVAGHAFASAVASPASFGDGLLCGRARHSIVRARRLRP